MWFLHYCDSVSTGICKLERDECCFKDVNTKHCSTVQTEHPACTEPQNTFILIHSHKSLAWWWNYSFPWVREKHSYEASYCLVPDPNHRFHGHTKHWCGGHDLLIVYKSAFKKPKKTPPANKQKPNKIKKKKSNANKQKNLLRSSVIWESHKNRQFLKAERKKRSNFFYRFKKWVKKGELCTLCFHIKTYVLLTR